MRRTPWSGTLVTGLNFSPSVGGNPFHSLGPVQSLDGLLSGQLAGPGEPVIVCVHVTAPRFAARRPCARAIVC